MNALMLSNILQIVYSVLLLWMIHDRNNLDIVYGGIFMIIQRMIG